MSPLLKAHLISALNTFIATFLTALVTTLSTMDIGNLTNSLLVSTVIASINVAIRALVKEALISK